MFEARRVAHKRIGAANESRENAMNAVIVERHEGWAELVLNRPERRNAIEGTLAAAMR